MKVSKDFIMREIAGEYLLVPVGAAAAQFNGLITMNELGKFIFGLLAQEHSLHALAEKIAAEYDVSVETAERDAQEFLDQLREVGALEQA